MGVLRQYPRSIRFVVLDDHELVRLGLAQRLLTDFTGSRIIYSGANLADAASEARKGCSCAVVDLDLGNGAGVTEIVSTFALIPVPVVVVSALADQGVLAAAFAAGASGYVNKRSDLHELTEAIRAALKGGSWVAPQLAEQVARSSVELSPQEKRALILYASGMTVGMVAHRMNLAPTTVKDYLDRVRDKYTQAGLQARTKVELNQIARAEGLLP